MATNPSDEPGDQAEPLGAAIARLRRLAGKTGQQLGDLVGMSQTKISRIETGHVTAAPRDVARILRALEASRDEIERSVAQAEQAQNRMTDWRQTSGLYSGVGGAQTEAAKFESTATEVRVFQPSAVIGLTQTSEYARAVLTSLFGTARHSADEPGATTLAESISLRVRRQEVLTETRRQFHFVMGEGALSSRVVEPIHMLAQIQRLRQVAGQENVSLKIVPMDIDLPFPLIHGFELLDDKCVVIDLFTTVVIGRGQEDLATFRQVFDRLEESAVDALPLLDKYRVRYRDLLD